MSRFFSSFYSRKQKNSKFIYFVSCIFRGEQPAAIGIFYSQQKKKNLNICVCVTVALRMYTQYKKKFLLSITHVLLILEFQWLCGGARHSGQFAKLLIFFFLVIFHQHCTSIYIIHFFFWPMFVRLETTLLFMTLR